MMLWWGVHEVDDYTEEVYLVSFLQNADSAKLGGLKRTGPRSNKFKMWKLEVEDALILLLGKDSTAVERFREIDWPLHRGTDFNEAMDEARLILEAALPMVILKYPTLKNLSPVMPKGPFPTPLDSILSEVEVCAKVGVWTAAIILIRKAVEVAIILRFDKENKSDMLRTEKGNTLTFVEMVGRAQKEGFLSPGRAAEIRQIKSYGDSGAHSYRIVIDENDVKHAMTLLRLCLGELFPESQVK